MSEEKITTKCTHCGQRMRVREIYVGKKIKCPQCGEAFYIEKLDESAEFGTESSPMTETELPNDNNANEESASYPAGLSEFGESVQNDDVLSESDLGSDAEDISEISDADVADVPELAENAGDFEKSEQDIVPAPFPDDADTTDEDDIPPLLDDENSDLADETPLPQSTTPFAEQDVPKPYRVEGIAGDYRTPKFRVFKTIVPRNTKIIKEYNLGVSGLLVPQSTKVLVAENEIFVYSARRYLFGIIPGGVFIGAFPIEFKGLRAASLKVPSLFAALLMLILGAALSLFLWAVLKDNINTMPKNLQTLFELPILPQNNIEKAENNTKLAKKQTNGKQKSENAEKTGTVETKQVSLLDFWYLFLPIFIALIWVLVFWRAKYRTQFFNVAISRNRKSKALECIRLINEQGLKFI